MRRFLHPLTARCVGLLTALLLLGSQQAALAHMLDHAFGALGAGRVLAAQQEDSGHGAALGLSHTCTTCLAFAAFDAAPGAVPSMLPAAAAGAQGLRPAPVAGFVVAAPSPYRSRAPPASL